VCAAAFPATDDVIAFRDQVRSAPEAEIWKRIAESNHEFLHVLATAAWLMQRILQLYVRRSEFVDDIGVPGIAPELLEPTAYNSFIFLFLRHSQFLLHCVPHSS